MIVMATLVVRDMDAARFTETVENSQCLTVLT